MKRFISIIGLFLSVNLSAQIKADEMYVDYQKFLNETLNAAVAPKSFTPTAAKKLHDEAILLTEDSPVTNISISKFSSSVKQVSDEQIYDKRKHSVFIIGKLKKKDSTGKIKYEFSGTSFAINEDGVCLTNYHVLQNLFLKNDSLTNADSVYFILTLDKQAYFIDKILAYSRNNDIAIFKVNTYGKKLFPIPFGKPAVVGATAYCIAHPGGYFYYFSKGIVARNENALPNEVPSGYNPKGAIPLRMQISADFGVGSSGGPILDKYGNLIGMVSATNPIETYTKTEESGILYYPQLVLRDAIPIKEIISLLKK